MGRAVAKAFPVRRPPARSHPLRRQRARRSRPSRAQPGRCAPGCVLQGFGKKKFQGVVTQAFNGDAGAEEPYFRIRCARG